MSCDFCEDGSCRLCEIDASVGQRSSSNSRWRTPGCRRVPAYALESGDRTASRASKFDRFSEERQQQARQSAEAEGIVLRWMGRKGKR